MNEQGGSETGPILLSFGPFEVNMRVYELRKHGVRMKLQEKPLQILVRLLEKPGEVVTREMLRQRLWDADTFVDFDQSLNSAMKKLRQGLGDSAGSPRFIETQAKRGYRFLAPVQTIQATPSPVSMAPQSGPQFAAYIVTPRKEAGPPALPLRSPRRRWVLPLAMGVLTALVLLVLWSARYFRNGTQPGLNSVQIQAIVVLPLENLSGEANQDYFADGLTDAIIGHLARMGPLRVVSRTSAMKYKWTHKLLPEIARDLRVDGVVEGTVRRSGNRVQISAQLIEAAADRPLWSQTYERDVKDILTLQDEVAATIAQQIRINMTPREQARRRITHAIDPAA